MDGFNTKIFIRWVNDKQTPMALQFISFYKEGINCVQSEPYFLSSTFFFIQWSIIELNDRWGNCFSRETWRLGTLILPRVCIFMKFSSAWVRPLSSFTSTLPSKNGWWEKDMVMREITFLCYPCIDTSQKAIHQPPRTHWTFSLFSWLWRKINMSTKGGFWCKWIIKGPKEILGLQKYILGLL